MRFIDRLTTLVRADAHGVLEQLEERTLLARQHLRDAEFELARKRARIEALGEEARRGEEELRRLAAEMASLDADVELALRGGKEELARFSVRRLLPKRRAAEALRRRRTEIDEEQARIADKLAAQEGELEELRRRVRTRVAEAHAEGGERYLVVELPAADEEVELELLRRRGTAEATS
ncbi:MAG TPA: PspA/IM30 family protein [Myxococcota bacterium]|nr:PspA/IM30 family protein [Myxococcota bacterium]